MAFIERVLQKEDSLYDTQEAMQRDTTCRLDICVFPISLFLRSISGSFGLLGCTVEPAQRVEAFFKTQVSIFDAAVKFETELRNDLDYIRLIVSTQPLKFFNHKGNQSILV